MKLIRLMRETKKEMKKVKWLKRKEIAEQFIIINVISILTLTYFGAIDFVIMMTKNLIN